MKLPAARCGTFGEGEYCVLETEGQEGGLLMAVELLNILMACSQQMNDLLIGTVAHRKPDDLRRRASKNAQTKKVLVARD